jgi:transcription elongation GreA/GreB family factor
MSAIKMQLYNLCCNYVQRRIDAAQEAIQSAQQSAGEDTKSSAGDKYETGREMMQQETNRNMAQLTEANKLKVALNYVGANNIPNGAVQQGSLVITNNGKFYIAISAGVLTYNNETYFAVSMASPIGMQLTGKKPGDTFSLNKKEYLIKEVW